MTPTPQEYDSVQVERETATALDGDEIVISGMSGLYPQAHNVKELSEILYNKVNPVTANNSRWNYNHPELAPFMGKAPDLDLFDAQFFMVHYILANKMDAMARKILEQSYQAIYDAGMCPAHLTGKKVGVYIGCSFSDSDRTNFFDIYSKTGFGITGSSKTMFANRISYWLNLKGPSMAIDEACCSSTSALEQAYYALKRGECEAAIVGGCCLCLLPESSIHYKRIIDMSKDDKTKSFDQNAQGCVNSDAINVIFLQKAKDALRVYAEILHVKNIFTGMVNGDTGPQFGFCRTPGSMTNFMKQFYNEARVPPQAVEYVEALGCATPEADKTELKAIEDVFCENRADPVLVGSVTSNVGFTQAASGITAVTKVLLGYHTGELAANLHCSSPRQDVVALREGRMRIVTEHHRFRRSYVAINGMSFTGVNSHVLLHGHYKPKILSKYSCSIPRLVLLSGRQESGVNKIINDLKCRPIDPEEIALLHNIHSSNIVGHLGRGYVILGSNENQETVSLSEESEYFDDLKKPLWFVYSGMGSQWVGMGAQLMRIPIFAAAIERCQRVLAPKGLDLVRILNSPDKDIFDNIIHSFVGIAAVQIGLTDILHALGLQPDGIIGHSVGELGCAYADGCLTAEEMILSAYSRGRVSLETNLIRGSMAAVGLGYKEVSKLCPPEIVVACHNGPDSSTLSGPADKMREFVAELTAKGIFAREVPSSNIAYHSRYIADAGPNLLKYLTEVIKNPKPRSDRWLSTSVPQDKWHEPAAKYCSAEYQTNNLLNPVLFEETSRLIPSNAVMVEVAPHGLLQAILKRSMPADCRHVPLTKRGHPDNALHLLQAIGKLYTIGYNPQIQVLYPKVQFPVSSGTPMLSHLVDWVHIEKWNISSYVAANKRTSPTCKFVASIHDEAYSYLRGHVIRGNIVYPFAAALVAVWDTFAMYSGATKREVCVQFNDVHLYVQPTLYDQRPLRLSIALHRGTGWFEVMDDKYKVATGYIRSVMTEKARIRDEVYDEVGNTNLQSEDIYQLLGERDYSYSGDFQSIVCANASLSEAALAWRDNWVTFIDGLLQLNTLQQQHDSVSLPTHIRRIIIDVNKHIKIETFDVFNKKRLMKANIFEGVTRCGGVSIQDIIFRNLPARKHNELEIKLSAPPSLQPNSQNNSHHNVQGSLKQKRVSLQIAQLGDVNSLYWAETPDQETSGVTVTVHYSGLNITDANKATGTTPMFDSNNAYGMDFSGTLESGERVMGLVRCGAASTMVCTHPELLWPVPAHWSLEDAATVPLAFAHALYCLRVKAQLRPGMSVLVHGGAGALGQAAISVALALGCQVFTTVSDMRKKCFLRKLYPQLKDEFIGNSRDATFTDMVLRGTNGMGCHVVLSCVKGELKNDTFRCCHLLGITLDTVQIKYRENYYLGMYNLEKDRTYSATDFSSIFNPENYEERKILQNMLSEGISRGYVRPLSRVTYAPHDAARAFRLLATSRHRGRVLLRMQDHMPQAQPRLYCKPDTCHLLVCDEQPLGMQLAERLVSRGAKKLYVVCTSPTPYHWFKIRAWQKLGVDVKLNTSSLNKKDVRPLMKDALTLGPIEGLYIVATKITDNKVDQLVDVVDELDSTARTLCPLLKYFAVVSTNSIVGKETCLSRATANLPATMLDLSVLLKEQDPCRRDVVNAVERAVCGPHVVLLLQTVRTQVPGLLQQFELLTGVNLSSKDDDTTIQELGLTNDKTQAILTLLRDTYNIHMEEEDLTSLSVNNIKELNERTTCDFKPVSGLATFFSFVGPDEQLATSEVVLLSTLAKNISLGDEFDSSQSHLCIVPGMEGHHERFRTLCERLKLPAFVLQPGVDRPHETVRETAERFAQILIKKYEIKDNFYLLGYESGILVALELAAILEDHGSTGTIFCVGCMPDDLQAMIEKELSEFKSEEQLQDAVVRHMFTLMAGGDTSGLESALRSASTWSQKVEACVRTLLGRVPHSAQYARALIEAALARIERARGYVARARALRSQLVLLRAATDHATPAPAPLALQRHSQQPVAVHQLNAPLAHAASDMRVSVIINKYLGTDILQQFEKENLCDRYLIN